MSDGRPGIALITCGSRGLARNVGGAITALLVGETGWAIGQRIEASGGQGI